MTFAQTAGLSMLCWFVGLPVLFEVAQRDRRDTLARDSESFGKYIGAGETFVFALRGAGSRSRDDLADDGWPPPVVPLRPVAAMNTNRRASVWT